MGSDGAVVRQVYPYYRQVSCRAGAEDIRPSASAGRYLQRLLQGALLHSVRIVLDGESTGGRQVPGLRQGSHRGGGGGVFLPHEQVRGQADEVLRGASGLHSPRVPPQRDGQQFPEAGVAGPVRVALLVQLGSAREVRPEARRVRVAGRAHQLYHGSGLRLRR